MPETKLEHSDHILAAASGEWVTAREPVSGVDMTNGGRLSYDAGARFRVSCAVGHLLWCLDEDARSVSFGRQEMWALVRSVPRIAVVSLLDADQS